MKGSHIYERMNNPNVLKTYVGMINFLDLNTVKALVGNITLEANDHPRYSIIMEAYTARVQRENQQE